jgi:carbonic anhydrase
VLLSVLPVRDRALADGSEVAVSEHVRYTVELLAQRSTVIAERIADGRLRVAGLSYGLDNGRVNQVCTLGV